MHQTGRVLLLLLCLVQLATHIRAQSGAGAKPAQAKKADYPEDSYGSYSYYKTSKDPHHEEMYGEDAYDHKEDDYGCDKGCPNAQPADAVIPAYITHIHFNFSQLAEEYGSMNSGRKRGNSVIPHLRARNPNHNAAAVAEARKAATPIANPSSKDLSEYLSQKKKVDSSAPTAGKASVMSQTAAAANAGVEVHPAAVNHPMFLLPTSETETGRGFQGVTGDGVPTDQALAVGHYPGRTDGSVTVVHAVNSVMKVSVANKFGTDISKDSPTASVVDVDQILEKMNLTSKLHAQHPTAFYDKTEKQFVVTWGTRYTAEPESKDAGVPAPLLVCVSQDNDPMLFWTCWALASTLEAQPSVAFCGAAAAYLYFPDYPQSSYSDNGLFISIRGTCLKGIDSDDVESTLSAVLAFPKKILYTTPSTENGPEPGVKPGVNATQVMRATYLPSSSWYFSLPAKDQLLDFCDGLNGFNTYVLPARPQSAKDCSDPHFVMGKVTGNDYMSIAKLTRRSLDRMTSRDNAPRIYAAVLHKPDFKNHHGYDEGEQVIPQPSGEHLDAGDVGDAGRTYGATFHKGRVYIATTEFFGVRNTRVPSIYYAIVDPSPKLCDPHVDRWGMVASEDHYALAYPSIAARGDGAVLGYSYGSEKTIVLNKDSYPAYAGFATSVVACDDMDPTITVAKRGEVQISEVESRSTTSEGMGLPWGQYSAVDFFDDVAWFAGCVALNTTNKNGYGSWITTEKL